ncbi:MAG TPA: hypothetical protein VHR65_00050 [Solirubrobacterales bacterium]|nr:hypothetical protein [Solirubrobacterales bacterium]
MPVAVLVFAGVGTAAPPGSTDLAITKTDSPDPVNVGSTLTYTIQVQNLGPNAATGVAVTDQLPKGVDFVSATASSGQCANKGKKVTCELGGLSAPTINYGSPPTVTISAIPRQVGTISNTASVKGDQKDPAAPNNKATATTRVVAVATCRGVPATIVGTAGNDAITGTGGPDVIATLGGNDTIASLAGRDLVCAGSGNDYIGAGSAADRVFGGAGNDHLLGRGGPDVLRGGAGDDVLKGNRGADRLRGGSGFDRCRGGAGADSIRGCER